MGSRQRLLGNALGSVAVLAVLAVVSIGLPAWDRSLPGRRPLPDGRPYQVGAGVSVIPPADAVVDIPRTRPGTSRGTALFLIGAIRYAIVVEPFDGTLAEAAARLRARITATPGCQVAGGDAPVWTAAGVAGLQGGYTTSGRDGWYEVYLHDGLAVDVTVSGTEPPLREQRPVIRDSVRTMAFPGGS